MKNKNQSGFAVLELVLIVAVLALVGFAGYKVMNKQSTSKSASVATTPTQASLPTQIKTNADVSQSIKSLDATPIDSKLDPTQFDSSINALL